MSVKDELLKLQGKTVRYSDINNLSAEARRRCYAAGKVLGDEANYSDWVQYTLMELIDGTSS